VVDPNEGLGRKSEGKRKKWEKGKEEGEEE
jgi:hypothetical protein